MSRPRIYTRYFPKLVPEDQANAYYTYLLNNLTWQEGVQSRKGFTRLAAPLNLNDDEYLQDLVCRVASVVIPSEYGLMLPLGLYINLYRSGLDFCPRHSHPGQCQFIISLGATRTLQVSKQDYPMSYCLNS